MRSASGRYDIAQGDQRVGATHVAPDVSGDLLRSAMRRLPTGVTVVTTGRDHTAHGMTANAVVSVSLEPPLMLVSVSRSSRMNRRLWDERRFAINVLSDRHEPLARLFADHDRPEGEAALAHLGGGCGATGVPLVARALATVECVLVAVHPAGDHDLFVGRVVDIQLGDHEAGPLLFRDGGFSDTGWQGREAGMGGEPPTG